MNVKPISGKVLTSAYCIALFFIAGLSIASQTLMDYSLRKGEGSAAIVNLSGRQRMLSQRIAGLAAQYRLGDASARADLLDALDSFEAAHERLVSIGLDNRSNDGTAGKLRELYFGAAGPGEVMDTAVVPASLDGLVRGFIVDARRVADLPIDDPASAASLSRVLTVSRTVLLGELEKIVALHQAESEQRIGFLVRLHWEILALVLLSLGMVGLMIFRPMVRRITICTSELLCLATIDPLTGAANRRSFMERCDQELARVRRYERPASMLMVDIDRFKQINDTYGHPAGDAVLQAVGKVLCGTLRGSEIWGRMGGEEFAIMLIETTLPGANVLAERLRRQFAELAVPYRSFRISFTVSIGVAVVAGESAGIETALRNADNLMYQAKQSGRNRVVSASLAEALI